MKAAWGLVAFTLIFMTVSDSSFVGAQPAGETDRNRAVVRRHLELINRGDGAKNTALTIDAPAALGEVERVEQELGFQLPLAFRQLAAAPPWNADLLMSNIAHR